MDKIIKQFKEDYALSLGSPKWISKGGDILRYIGQSVILVKFRRDSSDLPWTTTTEMVDLVGCSGFEPLTGTYTVAWKEESKEELQSGRLTPEGFSFNVPEVDNWMNRFLPLSLHIQITEAERTYKRFGELWKTRDSMEISEIQKYCLGKQKDTVAYRNYISLIVNTDVEGGLGVGTTECRIVNFSNPQSSGKYWSVGVRDLNNNFYILQIPKDSETTAFRFSVNGTLIGDAKIIDIQG